MYLNYMEAYLEMKIEDSVYNEWCNKVIDKYKKFTSEFIQNRPEYLIM